MKLTYVIQYVSEMERVVSFFQDQLRLVLRFQSPAWSEFETGETTLALHEASSEHPAGTFQLGFGVLDIDKFYTEKNSSGIEFIAAPAEIFGSRIAKFKDSEGIECSISSK